MEFLNKHYEKLILLGMLLFFIFAMVNILRIASQTSEVKTSDLRIPSRAPDYKPQDPLDKKFKHENIWSSGKLQWTQAQIREKNNQLKLYSDLTDFPGLAICLVGKDDTGKESGCGALVPRYLFADRPCPNCGRILKVPPKRPKIRRNVITADDSDGDGMSNAYEQTNKLDPNNPYDSLYDADGDGFSNIFEMENNTDPQIARNHPPLWYRLRFVAVRRVVLPISFRALNTNRQTDPKRWDIQLNLKVRNRSGKETERTVLSRLNGTVEIEKRRYRIKRIERIISDISRAGRPKEKIVAGGTLKQEDKAQDLSKIYLEEELSFASRKRGDKPDKLEMQIGKPVYSSDRRPIFEDVGRPEGKRLEMVVRLGERFRVGNYATGTSDYILRAFDEKKMIAKLERFRAGNRQDPAKDERGKLMHVTNESEIPEDSRVIEPISGPKEQVNVESREPQNRGSRRRR